MRRFISITMVIFGLAMVMTGVWNIFPPFNEMLFPPHIITSFILGLLVIVHLWLNWKSVVRYFRGLGRWWVLVSLGFVLVIYTGIIVPILTITEVW